jgi:hypothetical protein
MARISSIASKPLFPTVATNPRRKDSCGFHSMKIILRNPGITYEDFVAKGGRPVDVRWDIAHGNVTTTKPRRARK